MNTTGALGGWREMGLSIHDGRADTHAGASAATHPNLVSSKFHDHVSKFTIPSVSHNEQHLPTIKMLNELAIFVRSARYPCYKRSPQPLITSAFKNVFL